MIQLGLTTTASPADAGTHKKHLGWRMPNLIIAKEEMDYITKIVRSLKEPENEAKKQKDDSLLEYLLTDKRII